MAWRVHLGSHWSSYTEPSTLPPHSCYTQTRARTNTLWVVLTGGNRVWDDRDFRLCFFLQPLRTSQTDDHHSVNTTWPSLTLGWAPHPSTGQPR